MDSLVVGVVVVLIVILVVVVEVEVTVVEEEVEVVELVVIEVVMVVDLFIHQSICIHAYLLQLLWLSNVLDLQKRN